MSTELAKKLNRYLISLPRCQDRHGFIDVDTCDSLLFSALVGCVDENVHLEAAEDWPHPGRWYRRPVGYDECYSCNKSRSTISRDMLLGVLWWAVVRERPDIVQDLWNYAWRHMWRMGSGRWGGVDTILNPTMVALIAQCGLHLGLSSWGMRLWAKLSYSPKPAKGYVRHLQTLIILLRRRMGYATDAERDCARQNYQQQPGNPLMAYAAGDLTAAESILLHDPLWPTHGPATHRDYPEHWPIQRDYGDAGLMPNISNKPRKHHGGDFIFCAALVLGKL